MEKWRVNFDYEEELFRPTYHSSDKKFVYQRQEFDFLLWWCGEKVLASDRKYPKEYLNYLRSFGLDPHQVPEKEYTKNWWGALEDIQLEKKLNSKITSFDVESKLKIAPENSYLVQNEDNWPAIDKDKSWVMKQAQSMSGRGIKKDTAQGLSYPLLVTPFHQRVKDIGTWVHPTGYVSYENTVDQYFQYKGTTTRPLALEGMEPIIEEYRRLGATQDFVIDSYQYIQDGSLKNRLLCEVNYRKSMGWVACCLARTLFTSSPYLTLFLTPVKEGRKEEEKVIWLSPKDQRFFHLGVKLV